MSGPSSAVKGRRMNREEGVDLVVVSNDSLVEINKMEDEQTDLNFYNIVGAP
jgi:hypothetical protein